jgi:hypothetical protein
MLNNVNEKLEHFQKLCHYFVDGQSQILNNVDRIDIPGQHNFTSAHLPGIYDLFILLKKWFEKNEPKNVCYRKKFLDAGCGIGNILFVAYVTELALHVLHGFENNPQVLKFAKYNTFWTNIKIFNQDLIKATTYGNYDIIYYYRPLSDYKKQLEFEHLVEDQMKIGAVLIPICKQDSAIQNNDKFQTIFLDKKKDPIYKKLKN